MFLSTKKRRKTLNRDILDESPEWMKTASEAELREFVKVLDENKDHPRYMGQLVAFNKECNLRAEEYNEERNGGEWI